MKTKYILSIIVISSLLTSCEKYLDVQPTGTLTEDVIFSDVQGYRDAMYGIYASMASTSLYGENLSYGFVDKLGQMFIYNNSSKIDPDISAYNYQNTNVRAISDAIWSNAYTTISYINNVIGHVESTGLKHTDLTLIKGEAYALRAFMHYDITRLFAENYTTNPDAKGIPYAFTFDLNNKQLYSLKDTYKNILNDLDKAESILANDDDITTDNSNASTTYGTTRYAHCNKYAVKAIKARVFYSMGQEDSAAYYAKQVIASTKNFGCADFTKFSSVKRFPALGELIFGLNTLSITNNVSSIFLASASSGNFTEARRDLATLYNTSTFTASNTDVRYTGYYKESNNVFRFTRFLENESEATTNPITGIPLIRLPEMYYILAECTYDKDETEAIRLLDVVRSSRGLTAIDKSLVDTKENFKKEMMKERMREMPGEGQVFFALKKYNLPFRSVLNKYTIQPSSEIFVLPWPQNELDFGNH
jgi:tetratricopeptide (TPR) repeat protein